MHIEDLSWDTVGHIFHGALWISNPFEVLSCLPDHLLPIPSVGFGLSYLAHCGPPDCRLYPPGDCSRSGNLVAFILGTYTGDCGGIS
jgi:hypothetical protein